MKTQDAERLHIVVAGRRNSGKSSLVNLVTGQQVSLVSDVPGTTTDPVNKAVEIPGTGPCVFIDTAGFDDSGVLGEMRVGKTLDAIDRADIALLVLRFDGHPDDSRSIMDDDDTRWYNELKSRRIPIIPTVNIFSDGDNSGLNSDTEEIRHFLKGRIEETPVFLNAVSGEGREELLAAIKMAVPDEYGNRSITGSLVSPGECVLLVMPQDTEAPKGRLILPQVQTIRELLDKDCTVICCKDSDFTLTLGRLAQPPSLIITDSQVFDKVWKLKPEKSRLTSFSILFAGYKGDITIFREGAEKLDRLHPDSRILIAEACTHVPAGEDIGRVKIPAILKKRYGNGLKIDIVSGNGFPVDLSEYDIVIHCGACMFNRRYVMNRIMAARARHVPVTNYGMVIAWAAGILGKVVFP